MDTKQVSPIVKILRAPLDAVVLLGMVIATPYDYFKYKMSRYYKDTKEKYRWFCFTGVQLYETVKKEQLPIDFYRCYPSGGPGDGYYLYKDTLIYTGGLVEFDEPGNKWVSRIGDKYTDLREAVDTSIAECNAFLKRQACSRAAVLIDSELLKKHPCPEFDNIRFCTVCGHDIAGALRVVVESDF